MAVRAGWGADDARERRTVPPPTPAPRRPPGNEDEGSPQAEYQGYYGQLILGADQLADLGTLDDIRRAAREAGRRLSWKTTTRLVGGQLFVLDDREVPEEIEQLAEDAAADAMDQARREGHRHG